MLRWRDADRHGLVEPLRRAAIERLNLGPGDTVVDVSCATGQSLALIVQHVGETGRVIGVDARAELLEVARRRVQEHGRANIELVHCAVEDLTFEGSADAALFAFCDHTMRSSDALERVLGKLSPVARVATFGAERPVRWVTAVSRLVCRARRHGVAQADGLESPWRRLQRLVPDLHVQSALFGAAYVAWGTVPNERSCRYPPPDGS